MKNKTIKKVIGWLLLCFICLTIFTATAICWTFVGACIVWGIALIAAELLTLALKLISG